MRSLARRLGRNDGFTLIELLMAIMTGVVVTGALFAILEVSLRQTSRVTDRVQATQLGRIAMTRHGRRAALDLPGPEFAPVQEKSTRQGTDLHHTAPAKKRSSSSEVFEHRISAGRHLKERRPADSTTRTTSERRQRGPHYYFDG